MQIHAVYPGCEIGIRKGSGVKTDLKGIIPNLSNDEYHAGPGLSSSGIIRLLRSPAHFKTEREQTGAMALGSGFHALALEPRLFATNFAKAPEGIDRRTKEGKEKYAAFIAENQGKTILSADEYEQLDGMLMSIIKHKLALALLTDGDAEQSFYWRDAETDVLCKCRPDYLRKNRTVVDIKTTEDASEIGFQSSMRRYKYHVQSAFYLDGISAVLGQQVTNFVHVVIEKKPPYNIGVYALDDLSLDQGRREIQKALKLYQWCEKLGEWPGYPQEVRTVSLPDWMLNND